MMKIADGDRPTVSSRFAEIRV